MRAFGNYTYYIGDGNTDVSIDTLSLSEVAPPPKSYLQVRNMMCCALRELYSFVAGAKRVKEDLLSLEERTPEEEIYYSGVGKSGLLIATLNQNQWAEYEPVLFECGWTKVVDKLYNPNSGREVNVYVKQTKKSKSIREAVIAKIESNL